MPGGQVNDWMKELYPRWVAARGVLIVTPVYWYQAPSGLQLMMDRLVCADGGSPDPSTTHGKTPERAKALELQGWDYPRHLAGRAFAVVAHGDAEGADTLRRSLTDWLADMKLIQTGSTTVLERYIGDYAPYATNHWIGTRASRRKCAMSHAAWRTRSHRFVQTGASRIAN